MSRLVPSFISFSCKPTATALAFNHGTLDSLAGLALCGYGISWADIAVPALRPNQCRPIALFP